MLCLLSLYADIRHYSLSKGKLRQIEKEIARQKQRSIELELEKNRLMLLASYAECEGFSRDIIRNKLGYISPEEVVFQFE